MVGLHYCIFPVWSGCHCYDLVIPIFKVPVILLTGLLPLNTGQVLRNDRQLFE